MSEKEITQERKYLGKKVFSMNMGQKIATLTRIFFVERDEENVNKITQAK